MVSEHSALSVFRVCCFYVSTRLMSCQGQREIEDNRAECTYFPTAHCGQYFTSVQIQISKVFSSVASLLVDHPPEVGDGVVEWALRADPPLPVLVTVDKVGVDVVGAVDILDLAELYPGLVVALDVGIPGRRNRVFIRNVEEETLKHSCIS